MTVLSIDQGKQYTHLSDAIVAAADGDLLHLQAGTFGFDPNDLLRVAGTASVNITSIDSHPLTSQNTLVLTLSQDAWQGNAQFSVTVDGKSLGPAQEVTALRKNGATQDFTFRGDFGAGPHKVAVTFLNDAYGGTAATDRNLYVERASLNGVAVPDVARALLSAGAVEFGPDGPIAPVGSYTFLGPVWAAKTLTWSIDQSSRQNAIYKFDQATGVATYHEFDNAIGDEYEALMQRAIKRWDDALDLDFTQVGAIGSNTAPADIVIGFDDLNTNVSGAIGYAHYGFNYTDEGKYLFKPGVTIRLQDPAKTPLTPIEGGDYRYSGYESTLYQITLHEIGHALGLGHSNDIRSVMYSSAGVQSRDVSAYDIAGGRQLYGAERGVTTRVSTAVMPTSEAQGMASSTMNSAASAISPPWCTCGSCQLSGALNSSGPIITSAAVNMPITFMGHDALSEGEHGHENLHAVIHGDGLDAHADCLHDTWLTWMPKHEIAASHGLAPVQDTDGSIGAHEMTEAGQNLGVPGFRLADTDLFNYVAA